MEDEVYSNRLPNEAIRVVSCNDKHGRLTVGGRSKPVPGNGGHPENDLEPG